MPRYPVRPWFHPKTVMASTPIAYGFYVMIIPMLIAFPVRYKISRWYERQTDTTCQAIKGKAVRLYREIERMHRRELTLSKNPIVDEVQSTRMSLPIQMITFQKGNTDAEWQYWESHQKDVMRAKRLQQEIEDLKARIAAPAAAK